MMTKKKWFIVLCILILYILLGTGVFYTIESEEELKRIGLDDVERGQIDDKLLKPIAEDERQKIYNMLTNYCGKPIQEDLKSLQEEPKWDFYHALFFVITVVSTIGYGNLVPTTEFTRNFMIFYALIGIPLNGIVMLTLGAYFGRSFTKLYRRWKSSKSGTKERHPTTTRLGLFSQIVLYLVPGFTFFIFLPAGIMVVFESWTYDIAVYFCFVTLTTIGFGDYVAGVENVNNINNIYYWIYKIFLLVWVIFGLGYVVMILGFITTALRSKKVRAIEHMILKTPVRIRQELRTLLHELLFMKVKPVYKGEFVYNPQQLEHTQSCPDLSIYRDMDSPNMARKRALSECPRSFILTRMQSEADLALIDQDLTFSNNREFMQQKQLLMKVVDALNIIENREHGAYENLSDSEILASERYDSNSQNPERRRAISDIKGPSAERTDVNYPEYRPRTFSEPSDADKSQNLLRRLKNKFTTRDVKDFDVEENRRRSSMFAAPQDYLRQTNRGRASLMSVQEQEAVLEQTSIADFIRALSALTVPPNKGTPKRKLGTASLTPPKSPASTLNPEIRRTSLVPDSHGPSPRRFSLRPVEEYQPPPPYSVREDLTRPARTFSRSGTAPSTDAGPVQRQVNRKESR